MVHALCSIDSPPVNRVHFPEMNGFTRNLMAEAKSLLPEIEKRSYKDAFKFLQNSITPQNKVFIAALMI